MVLHVDEIPISKKSAQGEGGIQVDVYGIPNIIVLGRLDERLPNISR